MPRRIFGQKREGVYPLNPRDITTPRVFNKIRHWPLRPEFDHSNDDKIFKTFHTEFVNDVTPLGSLCCPRKTFNRKKPAVLRCRKGDLPPSKCGVSSMCYRESKIIRAKTVEKSKHRTPIRSQSTRKKLNEPQKPSPSKMNKKSVGRMCIYNQKSSLCVDYDTLEDDLALLTY